ncbi:MAG: hypothetical protein ACFFCD_15920 [Promethearchaeota archaeon]
MNVMKVKTRTLRQVIPPLKEWVLLLSYLQPQIFFFSFCFFDGLPFKFIPDLKKLDYFLVPYSGIHQKRIK